MDGLALLGIGRLNGRDYLHQAVAQEVAARTLDLAAEERERTSASRAHAVLSRLKFRRS